MVLKKQLLLNVPFGVNALWDGMKSLDLDMTLSGCIMGMTLHTRPEHIFRALVEASVFGAKKSLRPIVNMRYSGKSLLYRRHTDKKPLAGPGLHRCVGVAGNRLRR